MIYRELISRIRNTLKEVSKDSILTNKHIYNILRTSSIFLIKREADTKNFIYFASDLWSTTCINMIQVPSTECLDIPTECTLWRSEHKLPPYVESSTGLIYKSISSVDNSIGYLLSTPYIIGLKSKLKYNKTRYVWIENNYLYSYNAHPILKVIAFFERDIFSNNTFGLNQAKVKLCSRMDETVKIPSWLVDAVVKLTIQELQLFKQLPVDVLDNKNPNPSNSPE